MTERPTQTKQILSKLDELGEKINGLTVDVAQIKVKMEMEPRVTEQTFNNLRDANTACQSSNDKRFKTLEGRIDSHDQNTTWIVRTLIAEMIGIVMFAVYAMFK